jgi:hypothetical protein
MRTPLLLAAAILAAAPALAEGRSTGEICHSAGFRPGTAAFTSCVMRMGGDDPLAALEDPKANAEVVPDGAPPVPNHDTDDGRIAAGVRLPASSERRPPPLQGNIVINGENISSAPPPSPPPAPPPAAPPSAAAPLPSGFPPIAQPAMPVMTVPNWSWSGTGMK